MKKAVLFSLMAMGLGNVHIQATTHPTLGFDKVVLWGHKLHSHTHSYIHWAFKRAFDYLGYETHWLDNTDDIKRLDLSNALFITEGQVDQRIPLREDCWYILHNCDLKKYEPLFEKKRCIILQVYTHDCLARHDTKIAECMHYDLPGKTIYLPWATDLLPYEIDEQKKLCALNKRGRKEAYFVGTVGGGEFGNEPEVNAFKRACEQQNVQFQTTRHCSMEDNMYYVRTAYMAPALQGSWQVKQGYIPCRIFKNISYGNIGITNSKAVYELLNKKIVYNANAYQLFFDAKKKLEEMDMSELYELMDFVRDNHTYLNRIDYLLKFLEAVHNDACEINF